MRSEVVVEEQRNEIVIEEHEDERVQEQELEPDPSQQIKELYYAQRPGWLIRREG